jgi:hypothetical protein
MLVRAYTTALGTIPSRMVSRIGGVGGRAIPTTFLIGEWVRERGGLVPVIVVFNEVGTCCLIRSSISAHSSLIVFFLPPTFVMAIP